MNYNIIRKLFAIILGSFWGYRANLAVNKGITIGQYFISLFIVMLFLFILAFFVSKEKKTSNIEVIKKGVWEDVTWAIIAGVFGFVLPYFFDLIFK